VLQRATRSRPGATSGVIGLRSASALAKCDLTLSRRQVSTPMVIIDDRVLIDASALGGRSQQAPTVGLSKWSAVPPVDQAIPSKATFWSGLQCAVVAVCRASLEPAHGNVIVAVVAAGLGRAREARIRASKQRRARAAGELSLADSCEVTLAAILVALTLAPCRWLPGPQGMSVWEPDPGARPPGVLVSPADWA
jgi:hypothetical protein